MDKKCISRLGLLLLALHLLSAQVVQAQSTTGSPMNKTVSNHTMGPTPSVNTTTAKSGSGRTDAFTLLLPLALGASLLHGWS